MVFTEDVFLFYFLPLVLAVYYLIPVPANPKAGRSRYWMRNLWLTLMGYLFYSWFEPWFVLPMMFTNVADYWFGMYLGKDGVAPGRRKLVLVISMIMNLGYWAYSSTGSSPRRTSTTSSPPWGNLPSACFKSRSPSASRSIRSTA
jgi:alginate O-acetyltransferase complex protein AlgI